MERLYKRQMPASAGGGSPDTEVIRAARHNMRYHLAYIGWLVRTRDWLAGPRLSYADLAAAAHISAGDPLKILRSRERGAISVYARGEDYHEIIKPKLKALAHWLCVQAGGDARVFVDTAAVMEKPLAASAGIGWQGKHTNLVSRQFGSWLFLGAIFTTLDLPPDAPES